MSETVDGEVVGLLGEGAVADDVAGEIRQLTPEMAVDASIDVLVVVGESALCDLVAAGVPSAPVLPVAAGRGIRSIPRDAVEDALTQLTRDEATPVAYPVLGVSVGDTETRALFECMLVTAGPARISEYTVTSGETRVSQFRADGVVVATPAGSHGYARRVDAPVVDPDTGVLAVAPVAPFATSADHWVVPPEDLRLRVERDDEPVHLLSDDRTIGPVGPGDPVSVSAVDELTLLVVAESQPPFPDSQR